MKKHLINIMIFLGCIFTYSETWMFPSGSYYQHLGEYGKKFDFSYNPASYNGPYYHYLDGFEGPAYVVNDEAIYSFKNGMFAFYRTKIKVNQYGFLEYKSNKQNVYFIIGGGYLADNIPVKSHWYYKDYDFYLNEICEYWRDLLLTNSFYFDYHNARDKRINDKNNSVKYIEAIDVMGIIPNEVKSIKMNEPFYEENLQGKHILYNDEILKFRWFNTLWPRGTNRVQYINCTKPMVEGSPGNGVGVELDVEFHIPSDNIVILNGYADWNKQHLYKQNARMKKVKVEGDGFSLEYEFEDYVHFAQIDFPKQADKVKITVLEVYDGSKWADMAISGIWVNPDVTKTADSKIAQEYLEYAKQHCVEVE